MSPPRVSSALKAVELKQLPPPMIIGERVNTQGSRKAKQLVLNDDFDGLVDLARAQVEDGAHCLDVCVATTERADEKDFMLKLVKRISLEVDAPLVIDSTDPDVIAAALEQIPGRPIINSINLEGDGSRFKKLAEKEANRLKNESRKKIKEKIATFLYLLASILACFAEIIPKSIPASRALSVS